MQGYRVLALAAATGRIGYVFFVGGELKDYGKSLAASRSVEATEKYARGLIKQLLPDAVVTEDTDPPCRKGERTKFLIEAMAGVATDAELLDIQIARSRPYQNKYLEAEELAKRWQELQPEVPRFRRFFETEPRNTIYFEALALALPVLPEADPHPEPGGDG